MPAKEATWTTDRIELLKNHFAAGLSCREIANEIGVTRNAVIGKLARLNLTREKKPDLRRVSPKASRPRSVPRLQYRILRRLFSEAPPVEDDQSIQSEQHCSLLELSEERCRWPINSPGEEDFCFCGNQPLHGLPYCAGHSRLAYQPGSSRQRAARG
ncbi:GcrA family cell cycle regulator [Bradyrhizobium sp.]|jgi:GcrA cell cycle regulator|uniref:GcrA family cell cycle regulator n=1 Tax=Bradyrhizobium sp. TaxID=376 RepID=UPI002D7512AB|nr:GcrA family cell cycle regulator [Bradyrhizobium sp.]HZR76271.1 GcrA family cell cycle regulator [Bradyrhizobium sp.]